MLSPEKMEYATLTLKGLKSLREFNDQIYVEKFRVPTLIDMVSNSKVRLHGLWFTPEEVYIYTKEEYPEMYL